MATRNIRDVVIIGAGPSGLAAAKVQIFDQRHSVGGVWTHNALTVLDAEFSIPRTKPSEQVDNPISLPGNDLAQFVSPVYDSLETNIPHTLMNFSDQSFPHGTSLFPKHKAVKDYLQAYAEELKPFISLSTQVLRVHKVVQETQKRWEVEVLDLKTKKTTKTSFDAVLVASGHYSDPFIPEIRGLAEFHRAHPFSVSHSKFFKNPSAFKDKKVIVVGNSASGIDLSTQISKVCKLPVIVSEKSPPNTPSSDNNTWAEYKPEIVEFVPYSRGVRFSNGDIESDVDHILFCTGYFYSFPFMQKLSPPVVTDGSAARNLYQHLLYIHDPTLAFIGIPQRIVPFPFAEAQAAWIARLWSGRIPEPDAAQVSDWELHALEVHKQGKPLHVLKFPKDVNYINMLHDQSTSAIKRQGLENDGAGKPPPYWGDEKAWIRERFPLIKLASRKLGDERHSITSLKQLGFDYLAWKAENSLTNSGFPSGLSGNVTKQVETAA